MEALSIWIRMGMCDKMLVMAIRTKLDRKDLRPLRPGGPLLPRKMTVFVEDEPGQPYNLKLDVELRDGRIGCEHLEATRKENGQPVSSAGMRAIRIGAIVRNAVLEHTYAVARWKGDAERRDWPLRDDLPTVAAAYEVLYALGENPTAEIARRLGLSWSSAAKRVAACRREGLLGPSAGPGKAAI
jgi:hypothetical protein